MRRVRERWILLQSAVVVAVFLLGALPARRASASQDWISLHAGGLLANANGASNSGAQFGAAGRGSLLIDISEFWAIEVGGTTARHFSAKPGEKKLSPFTAHHVFSGFRYNLDVFQYVPYVQIAGAAHLPRPPPSPGARSRAAVGAILTVGVDWRFERYWSFGVLTDLHAVSFEFSEFPNYTSVGVKLGYHFRL